uniref:Transcription repressor n=1 Tax=Nelumbo nucifera TaxID=4432 RepID=A0A822Z7L0_NELNU|nr:TPA_asm: hypothetical protein HUJ06_013768 [Nelumbo nucifera]
MEARLKMRISRMFHVIEKPIFVVQNSRDFHLLEPSSPKVQIFPSMCRPRWSETMEVVWNESVTIAPKEVLQKSKVSEHGPCFVSSDMGGRTCPASPVLPLSSFYSFEEFQPNERKKRSKKTRKTHRKYKKKESFYHLSSSSTKINGGGWFSSEDELHDETETFFSSRSFSSDSSESRHLNKKSSRRRLEAKFERRRAVRKNSDMGCCTFSSMGKVQESFAVVKHSNDPYSDFRTSMCFLSLNSIHHHKVIVELKFLIFAVNF